MTARTRALLEQTGVLQTRDDDIGHISDAWRQQIVALCDLLDTAPLDVADRLRDERARHTQTQTALAEYVASVEALRSELALKPAEVERALEKSRAAVRLVEEAVPRMQTLNNAMSPDWLTRAAAFLES